MDPLEKPDVTIGVGLIGYNEADNARRLIPLLCAAKDTEGKAIFNQIVVVSQTNDTQETAEVSRELGAEAYDDWEWTGDFAAKRNYCFEKLTTDWQMWLDFDDEIIGLEQLRAIVEAVATYQAIHVTGIWCLYNYDQHGDVEIAKHRRERIVRRGSGWHWHRPVHEHMILDRPIVAGEMVSNDDVMIVHKRDRTRDQERNTRNVAILKTALKGDKNDARAIFDLGSQYYHTQRWARAAAYYRHYLQLAGSPVERYQALHRLADCYRFSNMLEKAEQYDREAIALNPEIADSWFGFADCMFGKGKFDLAYDLVQLGYKRKQLDDFMVLNPLDYSFHPMITEQRCLGAMGKIEQAYEVTQKAIAIVPDHDEMNHADAIYKQILDDIATANGAFELASKLPDAQHESVFKTLPPRVQAQREVRDRLLSLAYTHTSNADITIFCGQSLEDWGPESPITTGIGGSETAVISLAKHLAEKGCAVDVYNQCGRHEGRYGNVRYLDFRRMQDYPTKLFVAWRDPSIGGSVQMADQKWLWLHDLHRGPGLQPAQIAPFDLIRPVSQWHASHLDWLYGPQGLNIPGFTQKLSPTANGIDLSRFSRPTPLERHPHRAIYASAPDRGLDHLLRMWPQVRKIVPDAELHIFYGWETYDKTAAITRNQGMVQFKELLLELGRQEGVVWRGRVNQGQLAEEMLQACVYSYSTAFTEVSCIAAMESCAAGLPFLSTICGALPETLGDAGLLLRGHPNSEPYQSVFVKALVSLMSLPDQWKRWSEKGLLRAPGFSWENVASEWVARLDVPKEIAA